MIKGIFTLPVIISLTFSGIATANDCHWWQSKLNSTERKLNREGNQSQIRQWQKERNYYADELEKCNKSNGNHRWIETANGSTRQQPGYTYEPLRSVDTNNPQEQQVIKTCNFWIEQYNENPNDDNKAMKNTACRNADNMAGSPMADAPKTDFKPTRPLKECVKPGNVVDNDVKLCMQGLKDPKWAAAKH